MSKRVTDAEQRERARLRSEAWRRAHGIGPRKRAQRPWEALGVSRATFYRRGGKIRGQLLAERERAKGGKPYQAKSTAANVTGVKTLEQLGVSESLARAESFTRQLQRELTAAAGFQTLAASILREFPL
jgi:hypothetical protein